MWGRQQATAPLPCMLLLTMGVQFAHPMCCLANYLDWVRYQRW
eukprot:gene19134-43374_t